MPLKEQWRENAGKGCHFYDRQPLMRNFVPERLPRFLYFLVQTAFSAPWSAQLVFGSPH